MKSLMDKINIVDDYSAVKIVEFMYEELVKHYTEDIETLIATVPNDLINVGELSYANLLFSNADVTLLQNDTPALSRRILSLYANDPALAQLAHYALDHWSDDRQSAKTILSVGLVAALLMFIASTSFTIKGDWGEINKTALSAEQLSKIADILKELPRMNKAGGE